MKARRAFTTGYKSNLTRRVVILTPLLNDLPKQDRKKLQIVYDKVSYANSYLGSTLHKLESIVGWTFPPILIECYDFPAKDISLEDFFSNKSYSSEIRVIIDCAKIASEAEKEQLVINKIPSHLISFIKSGKKKGWERGLGLVDVCVYTDFSKFEYLLHDIALDIAVHHAWNAYNLDKPLISGKEFSKQKIQFMKSRSLSDTYYGQIRDWDIDYCSFASIVRNKEEFCADNCEMYFNLWRNFVKETDVIKEVENITVEIIVNKIIKEHIYSGQLSKKLLSSELCKLSQGNYLFVTLKQGAHPNNKIREQIIAHFGKKKWRKNIFIIVERNKINLFRKYKQWLIFYPFSIPIKGRDNHG